MNPPRPPEAAAPEATREATPEAAPEPAPGAPAAFAMVGGEVRLGPRVVLRGIDLRVEPGEVLAVLGANGSGKSTLVRALLGLIPLSSGTVTIYGRPPARFAGWARIGYVPQRLTAAGTVPATVAEVVASGRVARARGPARLRRIGRRRAGDRAAVRRALEEVGLADRARDPVQDLSVGQQQRVLIARALAGEPDTFVMDEPTAGVDTASQAALAATLRGLVARGDTVVLVAHELGPLEALVTRSVVLVDGRIAHDGPPPAPAGDHARPDHVHLHPHGPDDPERSGTIWGSAT